MSDNFDNNSFGSDSVSGVEDVSKKKKGGKIAAIAVGAVVAVGAGGGIAYAASDFVKNKVKLATLNPDDYYAWVVEKNTEESASEIAQAYQKYIDELNETQSASLALKYEMSDEVKQLLIDNVVGAEASDMINNISSVEVGMDCAVDKGVVTGSYYGSLNDEKLATLDIAMDSSALQYYFRIPELTERWLGVDASSTVEMDAEMQKIQDFAADPGSILTAEELEALFTKYTTLWKDTTSDVELEKNEKIDIGDISVEYTVITDEIDGEKAYEIASAFVDEAADDELLKEIVTERLEICSAEDYDAGLAEAKAELEETKESGEFDGGTVNLITYVDQTGTIRGVKLEAPEESGDLSFIIGKEDDDIYGEFNFNDDDENVSAVLNAVKDGKTYSGDVTVSKDGNSLCTVEFNDLEVVDEEKGYVNADLAITVSGVPEIALNLSSDGKSQEMSFDLNIAGTNYGKLSMSISSEKGGEVSMPGVSDPFIIDPETSDVELEEYVSQDEVKSFVSELLVKIGFSQDEADALADEAVASMFYTYDDEYDDFDDDYNYDDDFDDDFDFDDDYQNETSAPNPDAASAVDAENSQAYLNIMDINWEAEYWGDDEDSLAYKAGIADIKGNGQYKVSVTADTDGYRFASTGDVKDNSKLPYGIDFMSICVDDYDEKLANAVVKIDKVTIDGKDIPVTGKGFTTYEYYQVEAPVFCEWYGDIPAEAKCADGDIKDASASVVDVSEIEEWTNIEVTFTVSGL